MPKTNIDDQITDGFRVEVSWARDSHVQIATVNTHSTLTLDTEPPAPAFNTTPTEQFDGWRVTLDRAAVNRLMKSLRIARDAAFGKDE